MRLKHSGLCAALGMLGMMTGCQTMGKQPATPPVMTYTKPGTPSPAMAGASLPGGGPKSPAMAAVGAGAKLQGTGGSTPAVVSSRLVTNPAQQQTAQTQLMPPATPLPAVQVSQANSLPPQMPPKQVPSAAMAMPVSHMVPQLPPANVAPAPVPALPPMPTSAPMPQANMLKLPESNGPVLAPPELDPSITQAMPGLKPQPTPEVVTVKKAATPAREPQELPPTPLFLNAESLTPRK